MAGNQQAYQTYMTAGHDAAWEQNWDAAIRYYTLALREFDQDGEALVNLGLSLLRAERYADALRVYERALTVMPDSVEVLEQSATALANVGNLREAAQRTLKAADVHLQLRDLPKAIEAWERALELTPGMLPIHSKLAQAYERVSDKKRAMYQFLMLAYNYARIDQPEKGVMVVERALTLDPRNNQALNMLAALRTGGQVMPPNGAEFGIRSGTTSQKRLDDDFTTLGEGNQPTLIGDPLGPIGEAMTHALTQLAAYVLEQGLLDATGADALAAMEHQSKGERPEAIAAYQRIVKTLPHPALKLNLGGLLLLTDQYADATKYLGDALTDPALAVGAMHALGVAFARTGKHPQAARYLIQTMQRVEEQRQTGAPQLLAEAYGSLLESLNDAAPDSLQAINDRFIRTMTGEDWPQRVADLRQHLVEIGGISGAGQIPEFLESEGGEELADIMTRIDRYIREGRYVLAMDEAHQAVEQAPNYLPAHVRMAEIMVKEGRMRQAINKYYIVSRVYLIREEFDRAASVLSEVIDMAPLDTTIRQELIGVLEYQGRADEALGHYIQLGSTYKQLGNIDGAREAYVVADGIARRTGARKELLTVKHALADIDLSRIDTRRAQRHYEEILELSPEDERAYRQLTEILLGQNSTLEAIRRLDALLGLYAKNRNVNQIVRTLEELTRLYPNEIGLRSRLANMYQKTGRPEDAIKQLDTLGELQLKVGLTKEAVATIQQIIQMNPQNVEQYRVLLRELGG
ncbi:MAG: tetratricopeptide repeat protein [Anaerolineae bacterium]|jgi:tetratricopeptide (TPR) repeat protein|nr:tetratricopeptide repeat protein [Anaerolineae bacterium]